VVVVGERMQDLAARAAVLRVGGATDPHDVVAVAAVLDVVALAAPDHVVTLTAVDHVVAWATVLRLSPPALP
jgi:hypothetical protein